jgi:hypothetical protein
MKLLLIPILLCAIWPSHAYDNPKRPALATTPSNTVAKAPSTRISTTPSSKSAYHCDGRTHCSQMNSCAEATFFLQNCPGVKMDGNHDGVPCEKQWCRP